MPIKAASLTDRKVRTHSTPGMIADGGGLYLQVAKGGAKHLDLQIPGQGPPARHGPRLCREGVAQRGAQEGQRGPGAGGRGDRPHRSQESWRRCSGCRAGQRGHLQAGGRGVHRAYAHWMAQCEARFSVVLDIGSLCLPHLFGHLLVSTTSTPLWSARCLTHLAHQDRDGKPAAWSHGDPILDHAKVRGQRTGENPARWHGHLELTYPAKGEIHTVKHHSSLPYVDMPAFWPQAPGAGRHGSARALEFAVLTAGRTGEVLGARWEEIDLDARVWRVPPRAHEGRQGTHRSRYRTRPSPCCASWPPFEPVILSSRGKPPIGRCPAWLCR